jgi:hypothetical protein
MTAKSTLNSLTAAASLPLKGVLRHIRPTPWHVIAGASFVAGIGSGWTVLVRQAEVPSPFLAAITMMLATFAGWYAWGFCLHLIDGSLFGRHAGYQQTLEAFAPAYACQALCLFTFTHPLGWLWTWIASYLTIVAWGFVGPRRLGMRTYQAIVAATLGMLIWLLCLLGLTMTITWDGLYVGIGAFLA